MINTFYNPKKIELKWYKIWEENKYFLPSKEGMPYCIVIPPPNITGTLHMGHGFQNSIMDALIRYKRMSDFNTLWIPGLDHAGIATQMVVENILKCKGQTKENTGRKSFEEEIWKWKEKSTNSISQQERRLGISIDWTKERFTLDPFFTKAVYHVFCELYENGLIYRGKRLVNWDPILNTAISDLEVVFEEINGFLYYIKYPILDEINFLTVATTRPETIFGDTAIAVHPNDNRYKNLIGKYVILPLMNKKIPIVADESIDSNFGSGCVKITPAHDFNDYAVAQRHKLKIINIFDRKACLNDNVPNIYRGLTREQARNQVLFDLKSKGFLLKQDPHKIKIPKGDRSGAVIEPYITNQWFIKMKELARPAINAVIDEKIRFIPDHWNKVYLHWLENIEDWCISRQLWWGHRIPVWYDSNNNFYVGQSEKEIRKIFNLENCQLKQDDDVLDTWFSAALWPFTTLGWPEKTYEFNTFYPTSVLVTGFDIIFFWVARMVMFGLKFTGKVPFHHVYITGLIRDNYGRKMSKSKGNILDPIDLADGITLNDLIQKRTSYPMLQNDVIKKIKQQTIKDFPNGIEGFGIDALRFTFCSLASTSCDINFDIGRLEGHRNFCTKIWNATKYVLMQLNDFDYNDSNIEYCNADKWIQSAFQIMLQKIHTSFENYRLDLATQIIFEFTWHEFCDWYLELAKANINSSNISLSIRKGTQRTLFIILESLLRVIHPFMPFITEELWQIIVEKINIYNQTIMLQKYPKFDSNFIDNTSMEEISWIKKIILSIRNVRGELNISSSKKLFLFIKKGNEKDLEKFKKNIHFISHLSKIELINKDVNIKNNSISPSIVVESLEFDLIGNIENNNNEIFRLNNKLEKIKKNIIFLEEKLNDTNYTSKAPEKIVLADRYLLEENKTLLQKISMQLEVKKL